ncbi:LAFA_0F00298g1_1 [Lachancea sp. 'fantastica']|nr:LAFA_0F00298g1_1 [Lachancea sp. 'fantastica']
MPVDNVSDELSPVRRGLLANLALTAEYKDARRYPRRTKNVIVVVIALATVVGPMGTSIVYPAIDPLIQDYHTTRLMVNVSVGVYLVSLGIFPLWWSTLSELQGRRTVYVGSFMLLVLFSIGTALAPNISCFIVLRMLCGAASASVQSVGAGTIADLYPPAERGESLGYYYLGALMSPLLSPIIGSLLVSRWNWRSTQWFLLILAGVDLVLLIVLLPETLRNKCQDDSLVVGTPSDAASCGSKLEQQAKGSEINDDAEAIIEWEQRDDAASASISRPHFASFFGYLVGPFKSLQLLKYPQLSFAILFSSVAFGVLYFVNMALQYGYSRPPYNFKPLYIGLLYIPNSVTYFIASVVGGRWLDHLLKQHWKNYHEFAPEARISWNVLLAVALFPASLLIFGWCLQTKQHWVLPLIGTALFGFSSMIIMAATVSYILDSLPGRGATGVALNNLVRQLIAAVAVFVSDPLMSSIGLGWTFTMLSGVIIVSSGSLAILKWKSPQWRIKYDLSKI